jgi:nicotinamidase-related amidase
MKLNTKTTALVLIDLQKGVLARPLLPHPASTVYARSKDLASRLRAAGGPIVWVRVSFASNFADAPRARVDPKSDLMVTKRQWGAFYGTDLDLQLRRRGVETIVLGGIASSIGVESTARSAWEHGYELVLCEDLCSDLSEKTHAHSFKYIFPRLARVVNSESITFE